MDWTQELQGKWTGPQGKPSTTMLSRKNSRWCRLSTAMAPGTPKVESTVNSAVQITRSPFVFIFSAQSFSAASPLFFALSLSVTDDGHERLVAHIYEIGP